MSNMKVRCNIILCVFLLTASWTTETRAASEEIPLPLASYNYGVTGEPAKIDTAFGNLGEAGPNYYVPSRNRTSAIIPMPVKQEGVMGQNETSQSTEQLQATNTGSNSTSPIQLFNTSTSDVHVAITSSTTEKSIDPNTTVETALNGGASTAGDMGTTARTDVSAVETVFPTNLPSTSITSGQSVSLNQTFEIGKPTRKPNAGPSPIDVEPGQQNGTLTVESNSLTIIICCLGYIILLISKTMY